MVKQVSICLKHAQRLMELICHVVSESEEKSDDSVKDESFSRAESIQKLLRFYVHLRFVGQADDCEGTTYQEHHGCEVILPRELFAEEPD